MCINEYNVVFLSLSEGEFSAMIYFYLVTLSTRKQTNFSCKNTKKVHSQTFAFINDNIHTTCTLILNMSFRLAQASFLALLLAEEEDAVDSARCQLKLHKETKHEAIRYFFIDD